MSLGLSIKWAKVAKFFDPIHFKIYLRIIQLKILVVFSFKSLILFLKRKNYSLFFFNLIC